MSLNDLLIALKYGTARSGDWAHRGRPGKVGGSGGGGGIAAGLRLDPKNAKLEDMRSRAAGESAKKRVPLGNRAELLHRYSEHLSGCPERSKYSDSDDPCAATSYYTGSGYRRINANLRGKDDGKYEAVAETYTPGIDQLLEEAPRTQKTMRVMRGVGSGTTAKQLAALAVGDEFQDNGYGSTSIDDIGWDTEKAAINVDIIVPKGSKGAYVEQISRNSKELEFLLPRGCKFRVIDKDLNELGGGRLTVELINDGG